MRLEWIEDILAVLDTGSFAAAADRRLLTASAFTRRIRMIEDTLGTPLFDRSRKPVTLLPHVLAQEAAMRTAARALRDLQQGLANADRPRQDRLTLACQHALTTMVSPRLARQLTDGLYLSLRIRSGTRSECQMMLLRQEVDFALIYETPQDANQIDPAIFDRLLLGRDSFVPVAALRDHPHLNAAIAAHELPLIRYPGDIYLGEVLRTQILPHLPPGTQVIDVAETGLTPAVLQFIRQGLGLGWLPRSVAAEALESGELTALDDHLPSAPLDMRVIRRHGPSSDLLDAAWTKLQPR